VSRSRPFTFLPADGQAITVEARANGVPGSAYVRTMGALAGFDMMNGPRCSRLTVLPQEVSRA
jgi:hypothetical protein